MAEWRGSDGFPTAFLDSLIQPPVARAVPKVVTVHGDPRVDNYFWLRDRENPETIAYLEAENRYTVAVMKPTEELQAKLYAEVLGRIQQTDLTVPGRRDDYFYYSRTVEGQQYSIFCRKHKSLRATEEILLDGNQMARGRKYFRIGNFAISPDHRLLAYSVDFVGDEAYTITSEKSRHRKTAQGLDTKYVLHARMGQR